jgi:sec-independent protein translocase protein TatA
MLLFIGATEVILILFAVLLLFGSKKIPEVARAMGKSIREFQKATDEIKKELKDVKEESGSSVDIEENLLDDSKDAENH